MSKANLFLIFIATNYDLVKRSTSLIKVLLYKAKIFLKKNLFLILFISSLETFSFDNFDNHLVLVLLKIYMFKSKGKVLKQKDFF